MALRVLQLCYFVIFYFGFLRTFTLSIVVHLLTVYLIDLFHGICFNCSHRVHPYTNLWLFSLPEWVWIRLGLSVVCVRASVSWSVKVSVSECLEGRSAGRGVNLFGHWPGVIWISINTHINRYHINEICIMNVLFSCSLRKGLQQQSTLVTIKNTIYNSK